MKTGHIIFFELFADTELMKILLKKMTRYHVMQIDILRTIALTIIFLAVFCQ